MADQLNHGELLKIYPWITKEFFEKCLHQNNQNNLVIKDFVVKSALAKGENYASQMIRANITYTTDTITMKTITILIKTDMKETKEISTELNLLLKEIIVYEQILPRIYELLATINDDTIISAKCYNCNTQPFYMAFEDLSLKGYKNTNRGDGFNYEHFKCTLVKLAKWHATTAVLMEKDASLFKFHMTPFIEDDNNESKSNVMLVIMKNGLTACAEVVKHWKGYELIAEKLIKTAQTSLRKKSLAVCVRNDDEFNALGHGDLWCNNIMFKESDDGNIEDAIMVDYSNGFWGSPCLDLSYLLFTSSGSAVHEREWDLLTTFYYEHLITNLNKLRYNGMFPTLTGIGCDVIKRGFCSAMISLIAVPVRKLVNTENISFSVFVDDTPENHKLRVQLIDDPRCKMEIQKRLDFFNRKGYFD